MGIPRIVISHAVLLNRTKIVPFITLISGPEGTVEVDQNGPGTQWQGFRVIATAPFRFRYNMNGQSADTVMSTGTATISFSPGIPLITITDRLGNSYKLPDPSINFTWAAGSP
jgi:hypothetical protein